MRRLPAAGWLLALLMPGHTALAQQLDLDDLRAKPAAHQGASKAAGTKPVIKNMLSPADIPAFTPGEGKPLSITVTKTLYLPPAMYGQWSVVSTLMEANADFFNPIINEIWILKREGDDVVLENPANGAKAAVSVDRVDGNTAVFHRIVPVGKNKIYSENPTVTISDDTLTGHIVNRVQYLKNGRVAREYYSVYRLDAKRISGARIRFRPEDATAVPEFEIESVQNQRTR
jgi:hypothetical protein